MVSAVTTMKTTTTIAAPRTEIFKAFVFKHPLERKGENFLSQILGIQKENKGKVQKIDKSEYQDRLNENAGWKNTFSVDIKGEIKDKSSNKTQEVFLNLKRKKKISDNNVDKNFDTEKLVGNNAAKRQGDKNVDQNSDLEKLEDNKSANNVVVSKNKTENFGDNNDYQNYDNNNFERNYDMKKLEDSFVDQNNDMENLENTDVDSNNYVGRLENNTVAENNDMKILADNNLAKKYDLEKLGLLGVTSKSLRVGSYGQNLGSWSRLPRVKNLTL